ncbi:MAG: hypothetical protein HKN67_06485, partial [Saprospiraceae bacterium]|nr:hypothetical protein [Saprospiraceae bacterium]
MKNRFTLLALVMTFFCCNIAFGQTIECPDDVTIEWDDRGTCITFDEEDAF